MTLLLSYCEETTDNDNLDNKMLLIYIVIGGDHGQGKFRSVCKFILRNKEGYNKDSYVIKNGHIYCIKDKYKIFQKWIASPIKKDLKYLMEETVCLYLKWNNDIKLDISYEKKITRRYLIIYQLHPFQQEF